MKKVLKKVDWFQVGVLGLSLAAYLAKTVYEAKKYDSNLQKQLDGNFEKKVNELIDKKLKANKIK